jgi:hypothetical protein
MFLTHTVHLDPSRLTETSGNLLLAYEEFLRKLVDNEVGCRAQRYGCRAQHCG